MCGRLIIYSSANLFADELDAMFDKDELESRYNVAPSSPIYACYQSGNSRQLSTFRWGLVPGWSKGPDSRFNMFNARSETIAEKPAYRTAFRKQRCLIPVDGFYEWSQRETKQPYLIHRKDNSPLVFAGIWDSWKDGQGQLINSCSIVVTDANPLMQTIHHRMPVIFDKSQYDNWLDADTSQDVLLDMLKPYDKDELELWAVSREVNSARNDSASLIQPLS